MNNITLHMDILEEARITKVVRGLYALTEWNLELRQLFRYNFPFSLKLPASNTSVYEVGTGIFFNICSYSLTGRGPLSYSQTVRISMRSG